MSDELPACSYCLRDGAEFRDLDGDALCADCSAGPVECTCTTWRAEWEELARSFPPRTLTAPTTASTLWKELR